MQSKSNFLRRNKLITVILAVIITLCVVTCLSFFARNNFIVSHAEAELVLDIKKDYLAGEQIEVPENTMATFNGKSYMATYKQVVLPIGGATKSNELTLVDSGKYSVEYEFLVDGKTRTASKKFEVKKLSYVNSNEDSSVTYGELETMGGEGLNVSLARGDVTAFNKPIKLDKNGESSVISFYPEQIPLKLNNKAFDCQLIVVTITDCYNPDRYIDFLMYFDTDPLNFIFMRTIVAGQGDIGLYKNAPTQLPIFFTEIDGESYGIWKGRFGDSFGAAGGGLSTCRVEWSVNLSEGRIYFAAYDKDSNNNEKLQFKHLINDFDDPNLSPSTFAGFTTGEVFVSVTGRDWLGTDTNVQIASIGNDSGEDLKSTYYEDNSSPDIIINNQNREKIYMQVGDEISLYDAFAYDVNSVSPVVKRVFLNYETSTQSAVVVNGDKFVPKKAGVYTAEYTAKDGFGNVGKQTLTIYVSDKPVTTLTTDKIAELKAGVVATLPEYSTFSRNGKVDVKVQAIHETGRTLDVNANTLTFTPDRVGLYTIKYTYNDGVKDFVYEYEIESKKNDGYGFIELPVLEKAYIKNAVYGIDEINVYSFDKNGVTAMPTEVYVSFDGGEYKKIQDTQKVLIEGNLNVKFKYVKENSYYETETVKIVDAGYGSELHMEKYFEGDVDVLSTYEYIQFNARANGEETKISFLKKSAYALFGTTFQFPEDKISFDSFAIRLSDNSGQVTEILYKNVNGKLAVSVGGGQWTDLSGNLYDSTERAVVYNADKKEFTFSDKDSTVSYPYDINTKEEFCNIDYVLNKVSGGAGVRIIRIQNQLISKEDGDYTKPQIYFGQPHNYVEVNSKITVRKAIACDALTPISVNGVTVSVFSPNGAVVKSNDGILLDNVPSNRDYEITLSQYGAYRVEYNVVDNAGKKTNGLYQVNSANITAPVITFNEKIDENYVQEMKVGYKYNIKAYTVKDDDTSKDDIVRHVLVYNDEWQIVMIDNNTFTPDREGYYMVYIYCFDNYGNSSYISYKVHAKA